MLSKTIWLPVTLSATAGAVDVICFLALGGLFTAHITGNLVIVAAHYTTGQFGQIGPLLAVPLFIVILGVVAILFGTPKPAAQARRQLLFLHAALLAGCLGIALAFGPFPNPDAPLAVLAGMLAVTAMAVQNALVKVALPETPSTAAMTTNTTQLLIDLVTITREREERGGSSKPGRRSRMIFACILGFASGCVAGASLELHFGLAALALPVILATMALLLGERMPAQSGIK
jgi:uncharacterized membrane protein YoaK (UPF0700 family)